MPVENPAAVNSSVRPRSRKRACYGLSRLRTGEAAEAPHRRVVAAFRTEQAAYELVKAIRDPLAHISHIKPAGLTAISNKTARCSRIAEHSGYHEC